MADGSIDKRAEPPDAARGMIVFLGVVAILYFGKAVLVPVTLALLLAFLLGPLVKLLRQLHLGRVPSVLLGVIVALGIIVMVAGVIGTQIADLSSNLPQYTATIETKVTRVRAYTVGRVSAIVDRLSPHKAAPAQPEAAPVAPPTPSTAPRQPSSNSTVLGSSPLELAYRYLSPILSPLATFGIVFIVAVFALLQQEDLRDRMIRLLGSNDLHRTTIAIDDGGRRLSRYYLTQLSINTAFGIVIGLGLLLIGVPNPILFGILSAILRFVPYVGSLISAVLPMALAAAVTPGWSMVVWTAGLYLVIETLTGQIIEPMVYGHSTGLSPFSVIVAAIFWSWVWGPIGLILSTPLTLCLVVIGRHVERLAFLDVMLGDRPPLTPVESFYQRILADDPDEAEHDAERLLKHQSLTSYYDEVALKGLQLAANDAKRGVLDADQLDRIKRTVKILVHGLRDHKDKTPPPARSDPEVAGSPGDNDAPSHEAPAPSARPTSWSRGDPILCIAGRGPLDEAASSMLVQLLDKHGLRARLVSYQDVSRERIETLDIDGVRMVCISYLDLTGSPGHLHYLMQRLHQRLPSGTPILVGLWPVDGSALKDPSVKAEIGADYFTSSLRDAVSACVDAAPT